MVTEKELKDLNKKVYQVDLGYKESKIKYTNKPSGQLKNYERNIIKAGNQNFKILSVKNGAYGFQGMAVAPIIEGVPDVSQVTVVAAGTYPKDIADVKAAAKGMSPNGSPQVDIALTYVGQLIDDHPDWTIQQLSGYSQSAYMLKVGAHYQIPTTVFSGWFQYRSLTKAEAAFMKENPHLFLNYRQSNDDVTKWNDFNSTWGNSNDFGTTIWVAGSSHQLDSWSFDVQTGQVKISNSPENAEGIMVQTSHYIMREYTKQLSTLAQLKTKLTASGGGLSKNERIYLEDQQALLSVEAGRCAYQNAMSNAIKVYQNIVSTIEELWQETLREAYDQTAELSDYEINDSLRAIGATEQQMVTEPTALFQQKIIQAKGMDKAFATLSNEIKGKITELLQKD